MAGIIGNATPSKSGLLPSNRASVSATRNNNDVGIKVTIGYSAAGQGMILVLYWIGLQSSYSALVNILSWNKIGANKAVVFGNSNTFIIKQVVTERTIELYINTSSYGILTASPLSPNGSHTIKAEATTSVPSNAESVDVITLS